MFKKKENRILFIINLILLLFILLFFAAGKNSTSIKTEKTSLLNNKYIPLIDTIIIQDPAAGSNLVLNKNELIWIGKTGEIGRASCRERV